MRIKERDVKKNRPMNKTNFLIETEIHGDIQRNQETDSDKERERDIELKREREREEIKPERERRARERN